LKPVIGYVGEIDAELPDFELVPFREGVPVDAVLIAPGEFRPDGIPEWVPVVEEPTAKALRRAIRRWSVTIEDVELIQGAGTVVFGKLQGSRLREGELAVREGFERSIRIREIRIDRRRVAFAEPGTEVAIAFGPVPKDLFRRGNRLRPGKSATAAAKAAKAEAPSSDLKKAILDAVGDEPVGRGTAAICKALDKTPQQLGDVFETLRREGKLHGFAGQWIKPKAFDEGVDRFLKALDTLHERNPGMPSHPAAKAVGLARLGWSGKPLDRILARLVEKGAITMREDEVRRPSFRVKLLDRQRELLDRVIAIIESDGVNTPNAHEIGKRLPAPRQAVEEILNLGDDAGEIVSLPDGVLFTVRGLAQVRERIRNGTQGRPFTLGEMRDSLGTSRRVAVALLEHLDAEGFTERVGEKRVVRN
jgi:DNA-binding MarR family transcriptional regulator